MNKKFLVATLIGKLLWILVPGLAAYGIIMAVPAEIADGVTTDAEVAMVQTTASSLWAAALPVLAAAFAALCNQLWKHRAKILNGIRWKAPVTAVILMLVAPAFFLSGCAYLRENWPALIREAVGIGLEVQAALDARDDAADEIQRELNRARGAFVAAAVVAAYEVEQGRSWEAALARANGVMAMFGVDVSFEAAAFEFVRSGPDVPKLPADWEIVFGVVVDHVPGLLGEVEAAKAAAAKKSVAPLHWDVLLQGALEGSI